MFCDREAYVVGMNALVRPSSVLVRLVCMYSRRILSLLLYNESAVLHRASLLIDFFSEEVCFWFLRVTMFCELLM